MKLTLKIAQVCLVLPAVITVGRAATVTVSPGANIQALVNANPAGTTFSLKAGTYRMQTITAKDGDIFVGQSGAILNGSQLLTSFSQSTISGITYWVAEGPSHPGSTNGACDPVFPMCEYPEDFFIDSKPLTRVSSLSQIKAGKCYYDYGVSRIYFLDTPTGHTVETSVTPIAFEQGPSSVTINGLIVEKYANQGPYGAIGDQFPGSDWTVENSEVRLNHGTGIKVGSGSQVINNKIHDNGMLGFASYNTEGVLLENNEIYSNNWVGFRVTYGAGGAKAGGVSNFTARGNYIHDNEATGLWCDGCDSNVLFDSNVSVRNSKNGIAYEVSGAATIRNNVVIANGFGPLNGMQPFLGTGVILPESNHVEVTNNFVANNRYGITLGMAKRPDAPSADLNNDYVHNNLIVMTTGTTGLTQSVNNDAYYTSKDNRFVNDNYCIASSSAELYFWMDNYRTEGSWKAYGEDVNGQWACPAVFISSPATGATVSGVMALNAFAADIGGIRTLALYVDGESVPASNTTYTYPASSTQAALGVSYSWNTTKFSNGIHTIRATGSDTGGHSSSASVTVTVQNP